MSDQVGELNTSGGKNRFKYISFSQRIDNLNFDVIHQIDRVPIDIETSGSHFNELLEKLFLDNLTTPFENFVNQVKPLSKTLAQILHHKNKITNIIKKYLEKESVTVLEPVLQLIPCLTRDLQEEFFPQFINLLETLINLLEHRDVKIIENTFNAIAYSLKYLSKIAVKKLPQIFKLLTPIMGEKSGRSYLRVFAAESFGFLIRKSKSEELKEILKVVFNYYEKNDIDGLLDGLSLLFLESVKNIDNKLHSRYTEIQKEMFNIVLNSPFAFKGESIDECSQSFKLCNNFISEVCNYTRNPNSQPINESLIELFSELKEYYQDQSCTVESKYNKKIGVILGTIRRFLNYYKGSCVRDYIPFVEIASDFTKALFEHEKVEKMNPLNLGELLSILALLLCQMETKGVFLKGKLIIEYIFEYKNPIYAIQFCHYLIRLDFKHFTQLILPPLIKIASNSWKKEANAFTILLTKIIDKGLLIGSETNASNAVTSKGLISFSSQQPVQYILSKLNIPDNWENIFNECEQGFTNRFELIDKASLISCYLTILSNTSFTHSNALPLLENLYSSLSSFLLNLKNTYVSPKLEPAFTRVLGDTILGQTIETIFKIVSLNLEEDNSKDKALERPNKKLKKDIDDNYEADKKNLPTHLSYLISFWKEKLIPDILPNFQTKKALTSINNILSYLKFNQTYSEIEVIFNDSQLKSIYGILTPALISYDSEIRLVTFEILSCFELGNLIQPTNNLKDLFSLCIQVDTKPSNLAAYRDKLIPLRKLSVMASNGTLPGFDLVVPSLCLSMFSVNFRPLWSDAIKGLLASAKHKPKVVSNLLFEVIESIQNNSFNIKYSKANQVSIALNNFISNENENENSKIDPLIPKLSMKDKINQFNQELISEHLIGQLNPRKDRLDIWTVYEWILKTFIDAPHLAESQPQRFTKLFLDIYSRYLNNAEHSKPSPNEEEDQMEEQNEKQDNKKEEKQPLRSNLTQFLEIFSKFQKSIQSKDRSQLEPIYEHLLASGENEIQTLALKCIETYKYPFIIEYSSHLHNILDDIKFRDEITNFSIAPDSDVIESKHRQLLLPYLVKLLYGRLVSRKGRKSTNLNINHRRIIILSYLSALESNELSLLFDILFKPFEPIITSVENNLQLGKEFSICEEIDLDNIALKNQVGFLFILTDILKQLGTSLEIHLVKIISILVYILNNANKYTNKDNAPTIYKEIRQQGLKRLLGIFKLKIQYDFKPFMKTIFDSIISSKLDNLPNENIQGPSSLLEMILIWSNNLKYFNYLVDYDNRLLSKLFECLSSNNVKSPVINLVLEVVENLFKLAENNNENLTDSKDLLVNSFILSKTLYPNVTCFLNNLEYQMTNPSDDNNYIRNQIFQRQIRILSKIAPYIKDQNQAKTLLRLLYPSLQKSNKILDEYIKKDIIIIISELIKLDSDLKSVNPEFIKLYQSSSRLFFSINLRQSRQALLDIYITFSNTDSQLKYIIDLICDINSFSKKRLDEPDYDKRLAAFTSLHQSIADNLNAHQWLPILYNLFYFLKNEEEMSLRNSASFALVKFMKIAAQTEDQQLKVSLEQLMIHVVFPTIKKGLKINNETIKYEFIQILGQAAHYFPNLEPYSDLIDLLGSSNKLDNEEREEEIEQTNFFIGIYHIQLARRVKVLAKFTALLNRYQTNNLPCPIRNNLLVHVFLPICYEFIFSEKSNDITYEAIKAISAIAKHLNWKFYYGLFRKYYGLLVNKPEKEKLFLKILFAILDGFRFDLTKFNVNEVKEIKKDIQQQDEMDEQEEEDENEDKKEINEYVIHNVLTIHMIPDILKLLTKCPDDKIADRIPLALIVAKLLKRLPNNSFKKQLPNLILNLCNLLKSREQGTRDTVRNTLVKVSMLFGAPHLHFIIKELQTILNRGFYRHILSYTLHSILEAMVPTIKVGEIDHSVSMIMDIIIEDLFGEIAKEKEATDYTGKQKEVKSRKSHFTLNLLTTLINFRSIGNVLAPIKQILSETDNGKILSKVDEALNRINNGLIKNTKFDSQVMLKFCHALIQQNLSLCQNDNNKTNKQNKSQQEITFTVQIKRKVINGQTDYFSTNAHKFVEFGMSLLLSSLKRNKLEFESEDIKIDMLNPFINIMGESLYSNYQPIVIYAIKIMLFLIKLPLPALKLGLPAMIKRLLDIVGSLGSTQSEVVQIGFKLLAYVIKHEPSIIIKEEQLKMLINLIIPDVEEPTKHTTTFTLIRAILSRQLLISSLYDLMDTIAKVMVTNQSEMIRSTCREVYLHFFLDYPQSTNRLDHQIQFLILNLNYEFETGRVSIMEIFNGLFSRISIKLLSDYSETIFLALVMSLINDESVKCREMTAVLIKKLISLLDKNLCDKINQLIIKWCNINISSIDDTSINPKLKRMGLQVLGLMVDALDLKFQKYLEENLNIVNESLIQGVELLKQAQDKHITIQQNNIGFDLSHIDINTHWEISYNALNTLSKMVKVFPNLNNHDIFNHLNNYLLHPHSWIRTISNRLLDSFYSNFNASKLSIEPEVNKHTMLVIDNLYNTAYNLSIQIKSNLFDDDLAQLWIKNMFFIGKVFYYNNINNNQQQSNESEDEEEEDNGNKEMDLEASKKRALNEPLGWILKKCSYIARLEVIKVNEQSNKIHIFKLFAALTSVISSEHLQPYLIPLLSPLLRTIQDPIVKQHDSHRQLLELANEVNEFIKNKAPPMEYLDAVNRIQDTIRTTKRTRKEKFAKQALNQPEVYAKIKVRKSEQKKKYNKSKSKKVIKRVNKKKENLDLLNLM